MQHWFLIRGLLREGEHWHPFPQQFQQRFPDTTVHFLDIPGNGTRHKEKTPLSVPTMARLMYREYRQKLAEVGGHPKDVYLLSISLGSMVTLELLHQHPQEFQRAVLMNTSVAGLSPFYKRFQPQIYGLVGRAVFSKDLIQREKLLLRAVSQLPGTKQETAKTWAEYQKERPVAVKNTFRQLLAASHYRLPKQPPPADILILCSQGDRLAHHSCSQHLSDYLQQPYHSHPWAGHNLTMDAADWVLDRIEQWLALA